MTTNLTGLATTAQDQFFEALTGAQDAVLEGVKLWHGTVTSIVPDGLAKAVPLPRLDWLPNPATAVSLSLDFAEKLFAHQRQFAEQVLAETTGAATAPSASPLVTVPASATGSATANGTANGTVKPAAAAK